MAFFKSDFFVFINFEFESVLSAPGNGFQTKMLVFIAVCFFQPNEPFLGDRKDRQSFQGSGFPQKKKELPKVASSLQHRKLGKRDTKQNFITKFKTSNYFFQKQTVKADRKRKERYMKAVREGREEKREKDSDEERQRKGGREKEREEQIYAQLKLLQKLTELQK